jgi:hypothetical protein
MCFWVINFQNYSKIHEYVRAGEDPYDYDVGACGSVVVKALGYKPEGREFKTRWGEILNLPNPSGRTRPWRLLGL